MQAENGQASARTVAGALGWRVAAWAGCAMLAAAYLLVLYAPLPPLTRLYILEVIYSTPVVVSVVMGTIAAMRSDGNERRFWGLLSAANFTLFLCELLLVYWVLRVSPAGPPAVSWPFQGLHAIAAVCFVGLVVSMTRLQDDAPAAKIRTTLDFVGIAVLVYVGILVVYARPVMSMAHEPVSAMLIGAAYPLVGALLIFGTLGNLVGFKFVKWRSWEVLVAVALTLYAFAISLWPFWSLSVVGSTRNFERGLLDTIQLTAHYILMMAAVYRLTEKSDWHLRPLPLPMAARHRWATAVLPALTVAVIPVLGYAALTSRDDPQWFEVFGTLAAILTAVVLSRSVFLALEHSALFHRSVTDPLTGLYNHRFFHDRLKVEFDRAARYGDQLAVIVIDIDDFGEYNNAHGHLAGDRLLSALGARLQTACVGREVVARLGGDEFGVLVPAKDSREAAIVCQRLLDVIGIEGGSEPGRLSASAGVASYPQDANEAADLLRRADGALFHAKETGKNCAVVFEEGRVPDLSAHERIERLECQSRVSAVRALAAAVDARDPSTRHHSQGVAELAVGLARRLDIAEERVRLLELAALMHDVGKLGVSDAILNKRGELTEAEWAEVRQHPVRGQHILASADLLEIVPWVRAHHERWDGTGYPDRLTSDEIPLEARILSICDAFEAMTSDRAYRLALTREKAVEELRANARSQFDPVLAETFVAMLAEGAHAESCATAAAGEASGDETASGWSALGGLAPERV